MDARGAFDNYVLLIHRIAICTLTAAFPQLMIACIVGEPYLILGLAVASKILEYILRSNKEVILHRSFYTKSNISLYKDRAQDACSSSS